MPPNESISLGGQKGNIKKVHENYGNANWPPSSSTGSRRRAGATFNVCPASLTSQGLLFMKSVFPLLSPPPESRLHKNNIFRLSPRSEGKFGKLKCFGGETRCPLTAFGN
ncbi:hypothetical protein NPIL_568501 [Nephila pilipes]|uniref:Uncharacterized protein n=1 Tax=Nephila pilipes TaxID=299642 RepID=A0A8X6MQK1_NEPPI|nr:hypothetical protein NPIL_568501 [Nephila pilipes]